MDVASLGVEMRSIGVKQTTNDVKGFTTAAGMAEKQTKLLTGVLTKMASAAGVFIAAAFSTKAIFEFQDALAEVSTLVDTQTFSMEALSKAALDQARTFGDVSGQVKAYYQIISSGAGTVAQATSILEASNKLAVGGVTTTAIAADGLTSVLNAYGDKVKDATAVSDALFIGMRAGKTTIGELSAGLGKVAPLAAQTGVGFDELVGSVSALTKGGISTSEAITGVRAVLAAVAKPTSEAAKLSKSLGIEFNAAGLQAKGLEGFLADLVAKTGGNTAALAQLFGGVEALVPVMALSGQAGADFTSIMEQMADKAGATEEAFTKMAASPGFQANRLFGAITAEVIEMSGAMTSLAVPALTFLADKAVYLSDIMGRLVAITAVMGAYMAGGWVIGFVAANGAVGALTIGLGFLRGALIRTGLGALIVIAGEIVYQLYEVVKGSGSVGEAFDRLKRSGIETWERIGDGATWIGNTLQGVALNISAAFTKTWADVMNGFTGLMNNIKTGWNAIAGTIGRPLITSSFENDVLKKYMDSITMKADAVDAFARADKAWNRMIADKSKISDIGSMPGFGDLSGTLGGGAAGGTGGVGGGGGGVTMPAGGGTGGTYADLIKGAHEFIAAQQLEVQALGMTEEAANKLRYTQDLLNQAANDNIALTPQMRSELDGVAGAMASVEYATKKAKEAFDFAKDATKGFLTDMRQGLMNGASLWESFGSAALNVLDKIISKVEDQLVDALFSMGGAMGGGGGGGSGGGIFGFLGSLFGIPSFAGGGMTGAGSRVGGVDGMGGFPAILHPNETVVDHTIGQSANQNQAVSVHVTVGIATDGNGNITPFVQKVARTEAQQASASMGGVVLTQANKSAPGAMARYQNDQAGSDYRLG